LKGNQRLTIDTPRCVAVAAALIAVVLLASTTSGIPIVWDEYDYLRRADHIIAWFRLLADGTNPQGGFRALSTPVIRAHWLFVTAFEGHPVWGAIPIAAAKALLTGTLHPLTAARLGTVAVFSAACGAVAFRLRKTYGTAAALVAVVALLTLPRLFSEAHFATLDAQLTAWWLILWAADASLRSDARATIGTGVLAGLVSATKFTGWLVWVPLVVSRMLRGDRRQRLGVLLMLPVGLLVFWVVNPPLWHGPLKGVITHFGLNLDRAHTFNIPMAFLGRVYDMHHPLPWYNTLVWLFLVTPVPLLVLGAIGLVRCVRTRDAIAVSLLLHWSTLMVVRALPGAPPHDGIRLLLPSFGFWAVFAGIGAQQVWEASRRQSPAWRGSIVRAAMVTALAAGGVNLARYYPQTLSHYSLLAGGVRGAARLGMEPTYWWDALDEDVLSWINQHPGEAVAFSRAPDMAMLREWDRLRVPQADRTGVFKWYVLQNRTGFLDDADRLLIQSVQPTYTKYAGRHPPGSNVPADLKVPLLLIFTYDEFKAAVVSTSSSRNQRGGAAIRF
jgi:hypothetical protein